MWIRLGANTRQLRTNNDKAITSNFCKKHCQTQHRQVSLPQRITKQPNEAQQEAAVAHTLDTHVPKSADHTGCISFVFLFPIQTPVMTEQRVPGCHSPKQLLPIRMSQIIFCMKCRKSVHRLWPTS